MSDSDIQLVNSKNDTSALKSNGRKVIGLDLDLYGKNLHFDISFGTDTVGLEAIVPVARGICDKITEVVVRKNIEQGERIPCCQGCANCCNYLITASSAEIFSLVEDVKKINGSFYKYVQRNVLLACKKILKKKPPEHFDHSQLNNLSGWYKSLNLSCPFLFEGSCSIYDVRPISCREYFIKGSPNVCKGKRGSADVLDISVSIANVLNDFCRELEDQDDTSIMLPLFQVWADENSQRKMKKFPAEYLVRKFVELLKNAASKTREESLTSCH